MLKEERRRLGGILKKRDVVFGNETASTFRLKIPKSDHPDGPGTSRTNQAASPALAWLGSCDAGKVNKGGKPSEKRYQNPGGAWSVKGLVDRNYA
jgi:hypothetical protein